MKELRNSEEKRRKQSKMDIRLATSTPDIQKEMKRKEKKVRKDFLKKDEQFTQFESARRDEWMRADDKHRTKEVSLIVIRFLLFFCSHLFQKDISSVSLIYVYPFLITSSSSSLFSPSSLITAISTSNGRCCTTKAHRAPKHLVASRRRVS